MADDNPSDEKPKFDPFKPADPRLPGVPERQGREAAAASAAPAGPGTAPAWIEKLPPQLRGLPPVALYGGAGAVLLLVVVGLWFAFGSGEAPPAPASPSTTPAQPAPAAAGALAEPAPDIVMLPATVATTREMSRAWSHKKFIIRRLGNRIPAMVLRIPVGSAGSSSGYWGFTLETSSGRCELELVTDLRKLASDYGYRAQHPMVVDPCTQTVFDPMRMGSIGPSTYTRGEVVRGTALRPPIAIEIRVQRGEVIAVRTE